MYPDLSYLLHDIFGTDINNGFSIVKMFGLLLALAFFASAYTLSLEFARKEKEGLLQSTLETITVGEGATISDLALNALIGFFIGFKILYVVQNFLDFKADAAAIIMSSKGNIVGGVLGLLGFVAWRYYDANKGKLAKPVQKEVLVSPSHRIGDITMVAAVSGLLGAKLFSVLENFSEFIKNPIEQFFSGSGLTMYGGLILAFIVVYWYVRKKGIPPIHMMDACAPTLMVGYGVGRLGCQLSGDGDWGIANTAPKPGWMSFMPDWLWAQSYPHNVVKEGIDIPNCVGDFCKYLNPPVFPTPLYESLMCLVILIIIWSIRKRIKTPGVMFCIYLIFNGLERFFIEIIRINPTYSFVGDIQFSQAQFIALALILIGIVYAAILLLRKRMAS